MKEAYNPEEHAEKHGALTAKQTEKTEKPEKAEKPKEAKPKKEKKPKAEKPKRDPHVRPLIKSHKSVLVVIPSDIRDQAHLLEAKEQGIGVRVDYDAAAKAITVRLLGEPQVAEKAEAEAGGTG